MTTHHIGMVFESASGIHVSLLAFEDTEFM